LFEYRTNDPLDERASDRGDPMAQESAGYRGARIRELPRANRTYGPGRVCGAEACRTKLSIYNKWNYCWQHEPVHTYVARGKRRSKKEMQAA